MTGARIIRRVPMLKDFDVEFHIEVRHRDGERLRSTGGYSTYEDALTEAQHQGYDVIWGWSDEYS